MKKCAGVSNEINEAIGFAASQAPVSSCTGLGTVSLVHALEDKELEALNTLIQRFRTRCPLIIVEVDHVDPAAAVQRVTDEGLLPNQPDMIIGSQSSVQPLLTGDLRLLDVNTMVNGDVLQAYRPVALDALRMDNRLIGLPLAIHTNILYYNRSLVSEPAQIIDELRIQASQGVPIFLDITWERAFWGIGAFGGRLFGTDGRSALDEGGLANWLTWLRNSHTDGIELSDDTAELRELFANGESAYFVGGSADLATLRAALGEQNLGIAQLPSGPDGNATPLLTTIGIYFPQGQSDADRNLSLEFASYLTDVQSQTYLAATVDYVPANTAVDVTSLPVMPTFTDAVHNAVPFPNSKQYIVAAEFLRQALLIVTHEELPIAETVAALVREVDEALGFEPEPIELTVTAEPTLSETAGPDETAAPTTVEHDMPTIATGTPIPNQTAVP